MAQRPKIGGKDALEGLLGRRARVGYFLRKYEEIIRRIAKENWLVETQVM